MSDVMDKIEELEREIGDNYRTISQLDRWRDYWCDRVVTDGAKHQEQIASLHESCETFERVIHEVKAKLKSERTCYRNEQAEYEEFLHLNDLMDEFREWREDEHE